MAADSSQYDLAEFISFRDREACERVRAITRDRPRAARESGLPDRASSTSRGLLPGVRRRHRRPDPRRRATRAARSSASSRSGRCRSTRSPPGRSTRSASSLAHVHTFNMDEYANEDGVTAPLSWPGSFQRAMWERFFDLVDADLRPPEEQIHFPTTEAIGDYSKRIEDLGGADVCYGGIGWCGHIAFWESHLGLEFDGDLDAYKQAGARLVELHPMTIMQNALHSFGGDWSWVPPRANTIGPREILGARHRSFWLDGDLGGGVSWQRFIARLVAHGPVSELVPGSILQTARDRLHDPRRRRRRRRDPHGLTLGRPTVPNAVELLSTETVGALARSSAGWSSPDAGLEATELEWGVSNVVLAVEADGLDVVVKQALPAPAGRARSGSPSGSASLTEARGARARRPARPRLGARHVLAVDEERCAIAIAQAPGRLAQLEGARSSPATSDADGRRAARRAPRHLARGRRRATSRRASASTTSRRSTSCGSSRTTATVDAALAAAGRRDRHGTSRRCSTAASASCTATSRRRTSSSATTALWVDRLRGRARRRPRLRPRRSCSTT